MKHMLMLDVTKMEKIVNMKKQNPNRFSRRDFIKTSSIGAIGLTTALVSSSAESKPIERKEPGVLNQSSKKLLSLFNLKYPFFQAAPGGEKLAVAIANAGGMGSIQFTWSSPDDAYETTTGNYYANYVLHFEPESLDKALEAGCRNFQFSWGFQFGKSFQKLEM